VPCFWHVLESFLRITVPTITHLISLNLTIWFQQVHNGAHLILPPLNLQSHSGVAHIDDMQAEDLDKVTQLTTL
jgi:hypothetical protein